MKKDMGFIKYDFLGLSSLDDLPPEKLNNKTLNTNSDITAEIINRINFLGEKEPLSFSSTMKGGGKNHHTLFSGKTELITFFEDDIVAREVFKEVKRLSGL